MSINLTNPFTEEIIKRFVFFGDLPSKVAKLIKARNFKDEAVFKEFFGKHWKQKLHIENRVKSIKAKMLEQPKQAKIAERRGRIHKNVEKPETQAVQEVRHSNRAAIVFGGDEDSEDDEFNIDLEKITEEDFEKQQRADELINIDYEEKVTYITDIILFPEDSFWTLREKIYLATSIPTYRQYIYVRKGDNNKSAHTILLSDIVYNISFNDDLEDFNGIKIDKNMYNNRVNMRIRMKEPYKNIDSFLTDDINLCDLADYKKAISGIETILESQYMSELLYYGLFRKYFPIFDQEMMKQYFTDEIQIIKNYPIICKPKDMLREQFDTEKEILTNIYNNSDDLFDKYSDDITMSITEIEYKLIKVYEIQDSIFIRNILNVFKCSSRNLFLECYVTRNNIHYRVVKYFISQSPDIIEDFLDDKQYSIFDKFVLTYWDEKYKQQCKFTLGVNGIYSVNVSYLRSDNVDFTDSYEHHKDFINEVITLINDNSSMVFNPSYTYKKIPKFTIKNIFVNNVKLILRWEKLVSSSTFQEVSKILKRYYTANILEHRQLSIATPNIINTKIKKGTEPRVNKFHMKRGAEVVDYYIIYRDIKANAAWNSHYGGKLMDIENNLTNITFSFSNVMDTEFIKIANYIISLVEEIDNKTKNIKVVTNASKNIKKKMKEIDPLLYNFRDNKGVKYSRICQKKLRPIGIYVQEEYDAMPKEKQAKLHAYINYTTGDTVYYECPASLPFFGFITGKHPKGFCIPKCKASETAGIKNQLIKEQCMQNRTFVSAKDNKTSSNILKFGKLINSGKIGYVHEQIYDLFYFANHDELVLLGIDQLYNSIPGTEMLVCFSTVSKIAVPEILEKIASSLTQDIYNTTKISIYYSLEYILGVLKSLSDRTFTMFENLDNILLELISLNYNINIISFVTEVISRNELLDSSNSSIEIYISNITRKLIENSENVNLLMILILGYEYYPILYQGNGIFDKDSEIVAHLRSALKSKTIKSTESAESLARDKKFTYASLLEIIKGKVVKYVSSKYINYLLINDNICVGVYNSININDGNDVCTDIFRRTKFNLPFSKLAGFLSQIKGLTPTLLANELIISGEPSEIIGLQIGKVFCWFNNTPYSEVSKVYGNSDIKLVPYEPEEINSAIIKRKEPLCEYNEGMNETYYKMYIYELLKYEIFKNLLLYRDKKFRAKLLADDDELSLIMSRIKISNRSDYFKIYNILKSTDNLEEDLNKTLLGHDIKIIIERLNNMKNDGKLDQYIADIAEKLVVFTNVNPDKFAIPNIITSQISYTSSGTIAVSKHEENIFFRDNRLKISKADYHKMLANIIRDISNQLLFTYEINNFNIFFVLNYFRFETEVNEKIDIQYF